LAGDFSHYLVLSRTADEVPEEVFATNSYIKHLQTICHGDYFGEIVFPQWEFATVHHLQ
ncbi:hypothetical protein FQV23_0008994, partial [Spheniscus humboldti]